MCLALGLAQPQFPVASCDLCCWNHTMRPNEQSRGQLKLALGANFAAIMPFVTFITSQANNLRLTSFAERLTYLGKKSPTLVQPL